MLRVTARGRPDRPTSLAGSVIAQRFDIAPLTAFAPGALGAARGVLDASLQLDGFDPDTGKLSGKLHLQQARVPLDDRIGTLRNGDLVVDVDEHRVTAGLTGKLGRGDIKGTATVELAGSTPRKLDANLALRQISLIRQLQPVIDADVVAHLQYDRRWTGKITVDHGHVVVPPAAGHVLLEATTPSDMVFVDAPPAKATPLLHRPPPQHPWLIADVSIGDTRIDIEQEEYKASGRASGQLKVAIGGESIGVDGEIDARRGDFELLGQRSQLDKGKVTFDGTIDPLLEVRIVRDLGSMTVTADVAGRASKPEITFSSDTGSYSQGDLAAIFVGGQPGGDRSEASQAATAAGAGYLSKLVSDRINKLLPIKLDLGFRYDAATADTSQAVGVTTRITENLLLEFRQHPDPRPDENASEGVLEWRHGDWLFRGTGGSSLDNNGEIQHRWHW
jgi:autotransporter translocation and assembly factor TamB